MQNIDWAIVGLYVLSLIIMSFAVGLRQKSQEDYYLGGQSIRPWQVGLSMAANQVSAISLIGAPAFIALKKGGGLSWLQYEMAIPLAMIAILIILLPVLRHPGALTIYTWLEDRFGRATRLAVSAIFLLSRSMATGIALLATAYVTAACTDWPLSETILIIGGVALVYTMLGGIKADIYSDIMQLFLLWGASVAVILTLLFLLGGSLSFPPSESYRLTVFQISSSGFGDGETFSFWPMLLGGFFLYVSYYGCDQSQAQRLLATGTREGAVRALVINGIIRYPLVLTYCTVGVLMIAFLESRPGFAAALANKSPDALMPLFFVRYLPTGILGLTVAGIFAASMSSIDSAINSLSAATMNDFILPFKPALAQSGDKKLVFFSRIITVLWGGFTLLFAFMMAGGSETVIELVNKTGSAFYGPVAAVFTMGILFKNPGQKSALAGLCAGFGVNLYLWLAWGGLVSWMWWNLTGFSAALCAGLAVNMLMGKEKGAGLQRSRAATPPAVFLLGAWFLVIVFSALGLQLFFK